MPRRQEVPDAAFCPASEASELLSRGDRSIAALSHGWLTAEHPDPRGMTLAALKQYLRAPSGGSATAVFVDYLSLPQKDVDGQRTDEEGEAPQETCKVRKVRRSAGGGGGT